MNGLSDIPLFDTFNEITPITKGMSGDRKYFVTANGGERLLLRISDISELERKKSEYALIKKLSGDIPMPKPVDFGVCGGGAEVYTLLTWIDGEEAEAV
ncbi:MAG: phosphotransferase, partial [Oscillospiraceae bacterium]|nr:phosphotransferase [Oscillospiraceae bacterium]